MNTPPEGSPPPDPEPNETPGDPGNGDGHDDETGHPTDDAMHDEQPSPAPPDAAPPCGEAEPDPPDEDEPETEAELTPIDPGNGDGPDDETGPRRMRRIWIALIALCLLGFLGLGWLTMEHWPTPTPTAEPSPERATPAPAGAGPGTIRTIPELREPTRLAADVIGAVDFGSVTVGSGPTSRRLRIRHSHGRHDRLTFGSPLITQSEDTPSTLPEIDAENSDCFLGPHQPDNDGWYCTIELHWQPSPNDTLDATLTLHYQPYVTAMERQAPTLGQIPGGWEPQSWSIRLTGQTEPPPVPGTLTFKQDGPIQLSAEPGASASATIEVQINNQPITLLSLSYTPPAGEFTVNDSDSKCVRPYTPGTRTNLDWCRFQITWTPSRPGQRLDTHLVALWQNTVSTADQQRGIHPDRHETTLLIKGTSPAPETSPKPPAPDDPKLEVTPSPILLGTGTPGQTLRATVQLTLSGGLAEITAVTPSPAAAEATIEVTAEDCVRTLRPGSRSKRDLCLIHLVWTPQLNNAPTLSSPPRRLLNTSLDIHWKIPPAQADDAPDRNILTIPIEASIGPPSADQPDATLTAHPDAVDFGSPQPSGTAHPFSRRIELHHTTHLAQAPTLRIEAVRIGGDPDPDRPTLRINTTDCTTSGTAAKSLPAGDFCLLDIQWTPRPGDHLDAALDILYRADGDNRRRQRLTVPVEGTAPEPSRAPTSGRVTPEAGLIGPTPAQHDLSQRRSLPVLTTGVGIITTKAKAPRPAPAPTDAAPTQAVIDPDYSPLGIDPAPGTSGRPVSLENTVLSGKPIRATIGQTLNARLPSPVTASIEHNVYGEHGANVVLPKGSRVIGRTLAVQNPSSASSGNPFLSLGNNGFATALGGRIMVRWERIIRPDGTAFRVHDNLVTADLMGNTGLPGDIDPKELETYIGVLSSKVPQAIALLLAPTQQITTTETVNDLGQVQRTQQRDVTPKEQAIKKLNEGIHEVAEHLAAHTIPQPTITVAAGTRIVLWPTADLWLQPIAEAPGIQAARSRIRAKTDLETQETQNEDGAPRPPPVPAIEYAHTTRRPTTAEEEAARNPDEMPPTMQDTPALMRRLQNGRAPPPDTDPEWLDAEQPPAPNEPVQHTPPESPSRELSETPAQSLPGLPAASAPNDGWFGSLTPHENGLQ